MLKWIANISTAYNLSRSLDPEKAMCNFYVPIWRAEYLRDDTNKHLIGLASINITAALPTILLNALVIFAVATRRRLRNNSTILLACLAGTDLLTGLVALPFAFLVDLRRLLGAESFCSLEKAFIVTVTMVGYASISHLVVISIDRYIAIKYPLRYEDIVTKTRIIISITLSWGFTLFMTIQFVLVLLHINRIYSFYSRVNVTLQIITGAFFIVVISWSYGYIYSETRRQIKRIQAEQVPQEEIQRIKKDRKAASTLAIILTALAITNLPAIVFGLLTALPGSITAPPRFICVIWSWVGLAIMLGSLFNPIIYCWRMKNLRRAFLEILHLRQPENTWPEIEMREIERHQPGPSTNQAFSLPTNGQPVLLSFRHLQSDWCTLHKCVVNPQLFDNVMT